MRKGIKKISLLLSAGLLLSGMPAMQLAGAADNEQIVPFGAQYSFDKFILSYKDAQTADVKIAFSEDGQTFGEYQTVSFSDDTDEAVFLNETVSARYAKLIVGSAGLPKIELDEIKRYEAAKDNVGSGVRGIDGNTKSMWTPGSSNFAPWFDGTYDENGVLTHLGPAQSMGLNHDAVKEGKTANYDDGMVELNFVFDEPLELESVVMYMDNINCAEYKISVPNADGVYEQVAGRTMADFPQKTQSLPSWSGNKTFYYLRDNIDRVTDTFKIRWEYFQNIKESDMSSYVDMYEMAFYYYDNVYESEFVLYNGAEYTFDEPVTFARISADLPADMWYVGTTTDGTEVDFREKAGQTGYFAAEAEEIASVKICGYNAEKVAAAKIPGTLRLYGEVTDLAKAAYEADPASVTIDGIAEMADFGADTRAEYMSVDKETGAAALFDGDTQYTSIHPYHTFVDADPDRLTLTEDSTITVDLGTKAIIDTVSYYAGPQYTPKKYDVLVSGTANFGGAKTVLTKTYEVVEGRLTPFINDYGEFYGAMREDQPVTEAEGQYVRIVNNGVLKPETDHLVISDQNGNVAVDTVMKNDAMLNKNVILAKELRIMGAPLVMSVATGNTDLTKLRVVCEYNDGGAVIEGNNKLTFTVSNTTDTAVNDIAIYVAVYDSNNTLKSVKAVDQFDSAANSGDIIKTVENVAVQAGDRIRPFVWKGSMIPVEAFAAAAIQ